MMVAADLESKGARLLILVSTYVCVCGVMKDIVVVVVMLDLHF